MSNYSRLIEIFEDLVGYRTITGDHEATQKCLAYAENIVRPAGLNIDSYRSNGFHSLVATTGKTKKPKLFLQAHLDVVPGDDKLFTLCGEGNRLVGRGAYDMKYAAACYLYLLEDLGEKVQGIDFGIMFTSDEENDGLNGVDYLLDQGIGCDICLLPDGGESWTIESAAKGSWLVKATATGVSAHGSRPWDGKNAAVGLIEFLTAARGLFSSENHLDPTLNISHLSAGKADNQVPNEAEAALDIRFLTPKQGEHIKTSLKKLAIIHGIELTTVHNIVCVSNDTKLPYYDQWQKIVQKVRGSDENPGYSISLGASDARYFFEHGIPTIVTRPEGGGMHGEDEWIDEAGLYQFYDCVKAFVQQFEVPKNTGQGA